MRKFKLFHGYTVNREAFEMLMDTLHDMDRIVEPPRGYELPEDDISDWDVTLSDGLGEE